MTRSRDKIFSRCPIHIVTTRGITRVTFRSTCLGGLLGGVLVLGLVLGMALGLLLVPPLLLQLPRHSCQLSLLFVDDEGLGLLLLVPLLLTLLLPLRDKLGL